MWRMSRREFPALASFEDPSDHSHVGEDIIGGTLSGVPIIATDIWAEVWDGTIPADLSSGPDTAASAGWYWDSSAGTFQGLTAFLGDGRAAQPYTQIDRGGISLYYDQTKEGELSTSGSDLVTLQSIGASVGLSLVSGNGKITFSDHIFPNNDNETDLGDATKGFRDLFTRSVVLKPASELTIAAGVITITQSFHTIDTQSDAASDDLDTISGGRNGQEIKITPASGARTVVLKDGTGNLQLAGDFSMASLFDTCTLILRGANWAELSRSSN